MLNSGTKVQPKEPQRNRTTRSSSQIQKKCIIFYIQAQLLAEIFSFEKKDKPSFKAEPIITECSYYANF